MHQPSAESIIQAYMPDHPDSGMTPSLKQLAIVTVTYQPDIALLSRQLSNLPNESSLIIVDNASDVGILSAVKELCSTRPNTFLLSNNTNLGLAAAINLAAKYVTEHLSTNRYLLLMDQDSVPETDAIPHLLEAYISLHEQDSRVACIGPRLIDKTTGLQHGFHCIKNYRWVRVHPSAETQMPIACANLNGSGTLTRTDLFIAFKGLDESLFIDHVDTDWSFRILAKGLILYGIPWVSFEHSMGERGLRFWLFGWRVWPQRSPFRHYYLFRNALWLMHRDHVPKVWKVWAAAKLLLTLTVHTLIDSQRVAQLKCMFCGLRDGLYSKKN
jgi:rhamnosyltransferase